ncbi:MAG: NAD(P)H-dependent oxidoreductase [Clostridia bacterium]|nr:NAD(P)H-dependent oxidoreductase [Clostridia bacterium]
MNILVLNGSPKGEYSITLQTVRYLEKRHPEITFTVLHVGQRIRSFEKDFSPAMEAVQAADALLFSYPVYTFIAPYQLHRFIELMKEHKAPVAGKYATQLSTSKHFYDVTAHRYIQDNAQEMGMKYVRGLSADMDDLLTERGQQEAEAFLARFLWNVEKGYCEPCLLSSANPRHLPVTVPMTADKNKPGDVVIIADVRKGDMQLQSMIDRFRAVLPLKTRVVNLQDFPFKGGCLGCFNCATDGKCIYKDGFDTFLRENIQTAQAMIYAFTIRDHSPGSRFKLFNDRQFCNGHRTVTMGMPVGYLISGDYGVETNLQMIVEGRAQVGSNILAGVATDQENPDHAIDELAASLVYALENQPAQPQNFYGIGGMKIFRDLIYKMRGMMKADHRFYKAHGQYDFPQKDKGTILKMYLVGALLSSPKIRSKMGNQMNEGMIGPYRKVVEMEEKEK